MNAEIDDVNASAPLVHAESPTGGPGEILGAERERLGWPITEVSAFLHLSRNVVEAIERDDYSRLPSMTFATGYLRAYAKFLNLDPDMIIGQFKKLGLPEIERIPVQRVLVKEARSNEGPVKWMSYVVALALGGLVIVWWYSHTGTSQAPEVTKSSQAQAAAQVTSNTPVNNTAVAVDNNTSAPIMPDAVDAPDDASDLSPISDNNVNSFSAATTSTPATTSIMPDTNKVHQGSKAFSGWHNPDLE